MRKTFELAVILAGSLATAGTGGGLVPQPSRRCSRSACHRSKPLTQRPSTANRNGIESPSVVIVARVKERSGTSGTLPIRRRRITSGSQVGLTPEQATAALSALVPALAAGFQRNLQSQGGLESLMSALSSGNHGQYLDTPPSLSGDAAVTDGNGILGHLLGGKDVSREVASRAAAQTGLSADVLKRMLPLAATLMMGAFSKQSGQASSFGSGLGAPSGIAAMLAPLLNQNREGSIMDDVTSMIGRFMNRS